MTANRKRGRPKGSGIDDKQNLQRIADIIVANPAIKRTTAIKKIGVSNPSIVRRLRDKFAEQETALIAEARRRNVGEHSPRVNGTQPTPRLDGLSFIAANAGRGKPTGKSVPAQALGNSTGQSKKTGPVSQAATSTAAPATGQGVPPHPLPGITSLFTTADVSPLQVAEDIVAIRNAILASTQPLELIISLLKGVNIEQIVTQALGLLMGVQQNKVESSPIASLIAGQAKMMDVILPLLQMQFAQQEAPAAKAAGQGKKAAAA